MTTLQRRRSRGRALLGVAVGVLALAMLSGCGSGTTPGAAPTGGASPSANQADALDAALQAGGELTYWTWTTTAQDQADAFTKLYPNVKITVVNAGTATDEYTKLQNAIKAGSGAPDVAQIEYYAMQQFCLSDGLVDLTQFGFGDLQSKFTASTWAAVAINGGIYGLPQDSGPMIMMYNKTVLDKYKISVPTTWTEYVAAAQKLHAADPKKYITNDAGDPGYAAPMIWQAGGHPFVVDGTKVTINLQDEGTKRWADTWNQMLEPGLLSDIPTWSDDWWKALGNGTLATLISGAWMPGIMQGSLPNSSGQWRVAPVPSYDGTATTSENGGSAESVIKQSKNPALAAAFLKWMNSSDDGVKTFLDAGGFPSTTAQLNADDFLSQAPDYYGGQKVNQVLVDASKNVGQGWTYLPFQVYANSVFPDTVGKAYTGHSDLNAGLQAWQEKLVAYGNQQGFTVNQ